MVKISFIGDIGLNDDYIDLQKSQTDPFRYISPFLSDSDLVVGNLECVLKGDQGENYLKRPRIYTNVETLQYVNRIGLGLATMATNHVYDHLENGFQNTVDFLGKNQISHIGAGLDKNSARQPYIFKSNNISICILNYITPDTNPSMPREAKIFLNNFHLKNCLNDLMQYKDCDYRVVIMHWGGRFEGGLYPDFYQLDLAKKIIDYGADLIIGHHSHTLQPYEKYKRKYIFYSIGNFCFSDIKFEGKIRKMSSIREMESIIVSVNFEKNKYSVKMIPFRNENLILKYRKRIKLKIIFRKGCFMFLKFKPFWNIYKFSFFNFRPLLVQLFRKDEDRSLLIRLKDYISGRKRK